MVGKNCQDDYGRMPWSLEVLIVLGEVDGEDLPTELASRQL
jgi:hypothetical protein